MNDIAMDNLDLLRQLGVDFRASSTCSGVTGVSEISPLEYAVRFKAYIKSHVSKESFWDFYPSEVK